MLDVRNYTASEILRDGTPITVLGIRREDSGSRRVRPARSGFGSHSLFHLQKDLTDAELRNLTDVDCDHVVASVVTARQGDTFIGGGRYCSEFTLRVARAAELAFITADDYRGRGIASLVLKHLVLIGRDQGLIVSPLTYANGFGKQVHH